MALPFFFIPVRAPEASEQELNSFQSSHKILTIDRHFVDQGSSSFWALRIDHLTIVFTCFDAPVTQSCTVLGMQVAPACQTRVKPVRVGIRQTHLVLLRP